MKKKKGDEGRKNKHVGSVPFLRMDRVNIRMTTGS